MGSFANALFSVLLGWLRGAASSLWQLVTGAETAAWIQWVLENWLPLTLLLCVTGVVVDLVVYIIRWQPYRVWRRFLHKEEAEDQEESEAPAVSQRWIYADGRSVPVYETSTVSSRESTAGQTGAVQRPIRRREEVGLDAPLRPVKRVKPAKRHRNADGSGEYQLPDLSEGEQTYHEPYYPPQWTAQQEQHGGDK